MRLGGPARYVVEIEKPEEIHDAYEFAKQYQLPTFVLGYGANTLAHDEGFNGVIIINRMRGITEQNGKIKAMGGEFWDSVVEYACDKNYTGIEAMSKIPGLAGAAPVQNIGAYGQDISATLIEVEAYDSTTNSVVTLSNKELQFSYRQSIFNTTAKNRFFIISITIGLHEGQMSRPFYNSIEKFIEYNNVTDLSPKGIRDIVTTLRANKLPDPLEKASCGSFFHNLYLTEEEAEKATEKGWPVIHGDDGFKINAGWLIEQSGFRGKLLHGIRVSDKAPLVLINESAKNFNDLSQARSEIVGGVYDKFGYWLEQEPVEIQ